MTNFHQILLAEDDADDRELFKEALRLVDPAIHLAMVDDGEKLMSHLKTAAVIPDYIFLDLNMPGKNGLECLKEIRGAKRLKDITIAIYSTSASEKDIEETFHNGANVYIKKPNDFSLLKRVLEKVVRTSFQYREGKFNRDLFLLRI